MTTGIPRMETLLEQAARSRSFPSPLRLHPETLGECSIDPIATQAFHDQIRARDINLDDHLRPVLAPVMNGREMASWFGKRTMLFVDVTLVADMPDVEASHETIWLLANRTRLTDGVQLPGFAIPAAHRVNGGSFWLEPLSMQLDAVTYAANSALTRAAHLSVADSPLGQLGA